MLQAYKRHVTRDDLLPDVPDTRRYRALAVACCMTAALAVAGHASPLDRQLLLVLNGSAAAYQGASALAFYLGLGLTMLLIGTALSAHDARRWASLILALVLVGVLAQIMKYALSLPRPLGDWGGPAVLPLTIVGEPLRVRSMPSGHTATAFAVWAVFGWQAGLRWRHRLAWSALLLPLAVALSLARVAAGAHWPSDILGGAALGVAVGAGTWYLPWLPGFARCLQREPVRWALVAAAGLYAVAVAVHAQRNEEPGWWVAVMAGAAAATAVALTTRHRVPTDTASRPGLEHTPGRQEYQL